MRLIPFSARLAASVLMLTVAAVAVPAQTLSGPELVAELRRGGYAIFFRHATTDMSQQDLVDSPGDWTSCDPARMRQLTDEGRAEAGRIGGILRALAIPVGRILSSEYCRASETARLLDLGTVVTTRSLMNMLVADMVGGQQRVIARALEVLGRNPEAGTNTVLVAHGNLIQATTGESTVEAGAVILRIRGDGSFYRVAEVTPEKWEELAARLHAKS